MKIIFAIIAIITFAACAPIGQHVSEVDQYAKGGYSKGNYSGEVGTRIYLRNPSPK